MRKNLNASKALTVLCSTVLAFTLASCNGDNGNHTVDMSGVVFNDDTIKYDGTAKTLEIKNLPEVLSYTFSITDVEGRAVEAANVVNVGSYRFTANFTAKSGYVAPLPMNATLNIAKGDYDMSKFSFGDLEFTYDGQKHIPTVSGVPEGVTANVEVYDGASILPIENPIDAGTYRVVAEFAGSSNYNPIINRETLMAILPAEYAGLDGISVSGLAHTYDGQPHLPTVTGLPVGVSANFTIFKEGQTAPVANAIDAGTYHVVVSFEGDDNHAAIESKNVELVIGKATYDMSKVVIGDLSHTYNGKGHVVSVDGLPAGVSASAKYYLGENTQALTSATDAGSYRVVVSFTGDDNHNAIEDMTANLTVDKATYDMSSFVINGLEAVYTGEALPLPTVSGLPEGVSATVKLFNGELEVPSVTAVGTYKVVVSFTANGNYGTLADRVASFHVNRADYDMSKFAISGLENTYDGASHLPILAGLPEGVTASVKLFQGDAEVRDAVNAGQYKVEVFFDGNDQHNPIAKREATLTIGKASKTLADIKAVQRYVNVNSNEVRSIAIEGDLEGTTPVITYKDSEGATVENINNAPVGTYEATVTFEHDNYFISNELKADLIVTDKIVKNISTYAELQAMAAESQQEFTLYEADKENLAGEIESWEEYNGGNPADRWSSKAVYQLVNDIQCEGTWKAAGWDVGHYMLTQETVIDEQPVTVIKGTQKIVNVPRADGPADYGFGYVSLFLDGNGYSIIDLTLANNTHENSFTDNPNELGKYPSFLMDMSSDYRRTGMFVSTAFSTFRNITFDHPTMTIDDTAGTVTWAGFINATESTGNTYEGLNFINPVINANVKKANIGGIAGITLVLARDTNPAGVRGADMYLDRPEEMVVNFKDITMSEIDFNVNTPTGGRNSVGGLYGENQAGWTVFNMDNVDLDGKITLESTGSNNNAADFFGFISAAYMSGGNFVKDPRPFYSFNVSNSDVDIIYDLPASHNFGTNLTGLAYHEVLLTADTYEANKYYTLPLQGGVSASKFALAAGAFDENEVYFELRYTEVALTSDTYEADKYYTENAGVYTLASGAFDENATYFTNKETFATSLIYVGKIHADFAGILNDKLTVTESNITSGLDTSKLAAKVHLENKSFVYDGTAHSLAVSGELPLDAVLTYENNNQVDAGEYLVTATFSFYQGSRVIAHFSKSAIMTITPKNVEASSLVTFNDQHLTYNGTYQEMKAQTAPEWADIEYSYNVRREIGSQTAYANVKSIDNPNYVLTTHLLNATFTIDPYHYDINTDEDTLIAVATEDKIQLTAKNLGLSGLTAEVVYFRSYEYFMAGEENGVSTNITNGTVIPGVIYHCGTTETLVFDRVLASGLDLVYTKFSLRIGEENNYEFLHNEVYCKDIYSEYGDSYGLRSTIKGIDYPPFNGDDGAIDAYNKNANYCTYNILLKDILYPNEYIDENGNIMDNTPNIPTGNPSLAIPHVVNGKTYYIKSFLISLIDKSVTLCKANNVKFIGIFYNHNETSMLENPYFATYPDARDPGSMAQFALNSSNEYGEGYIIAAIDFLMQRYTDGSTNHVVKDFIVGNELELCQRWYPIQTYKGNEIYSPKKFAAEYSRTLRLVNNTIKKYVADGNAYAPFSRYMSESSISSDFVYTIKSLVEAISYINKREGDFDWGVTVHPYNHGKNVYDIVYGSTVREEFNCTLQTQSLTYTNIEVLDKFLKQEKFLYEGTILRKAILCECGVDCSSSITNNKKKSVASLAFAYYRCACLDSIYALCMSDYGKFNMFSDAATLWTNIDSANTFDASGTMFNELVIFDRTNKKSVTAGDLGITTWAEFMDIWFDETTDWQALWNPYKIIQQF